MFYKCFYKEEHPVFECQTVPAHKCTCLDSLGFVSANTHNGSHSDDDDSDWNQDCNQDNPLRFCKHTTIMLEPLTLKKQFVEHMC